MKHSTILLLLLIGFAGVVSIAFLQADSVPPPEPSPAAATPTSLGSETPTKDNVSHTFRMDVARLEQRLETAPDDTTALIELAKLKQDAHQFDRAVDYYERYLNLQPNNWQAWLDLAHCYGELNQWTDAEQAMQKLLTIRPDDPSALYNLGAINANMGKTAEAKAWWEKARDQQSDAALATKAAGALVQLAHKRP